jgi:hyperosmotically inducible protein
MLLAGVLMTAAALVAPVSASAARSDPWITTKAKIALLSDPDVSGLAINVDTVNGRVTLHGDVMSAAEKTEAERIVRSVEGVTDVRNMLRVATGEGATAKPAAKLDDATLKERVTQSLQSDPALKTSDIKVASVDDGVVTLEGKARTMSEHRRALEKVRKIDSVGEVHSKIEAPGELSDDEVWHETGDAVAASGQKAKDAAADVGTTAKDMWITTATKVRLIANEKAPALDINVDTRDGEVTLFGMVPSDAAKAAAESEARKVNGVVAVKNELEVVPPRMQEQIQAQDDELQAAIAKKIDASAELDDADIDVEVSNGIARLKGTVESQSDRLNALISARGVPGIRSAIDELKVDASDASTDAGARREKEDQLERNRDTGPYDGDAQNDAGDAPLL